MCLSLLALVLLGPRIVGVVWWILQIPRWQAVFANWVGLWWIWPVLGILFLPWTTLLYVLVGSGGVTGLEWLWILLGVIVDIGSMGGGAFRQQIPAYQGA